MPTMQGASGQTTNAVVWAFTSTTLVFVVLRLFSRLRLTNFAGLDDVFIVISFLFGLLMSIVASIAVGRGYGSHASDISPEQLVDAKKWILVLRCASSFALALPKVSFAALLVRVFCPARWLARTLYGMAGFGIVVALINSLLWILQCIPVQASYDRAISGNCLPISVLYNFSMFQFAQSVAWDFTYAIYPIVVLSKLQTSRSRKVALCISMGLGIVAGIVGIYKCISLSLLPAAAEMDPTFSDPIGTIWISAEGNLLILAACIPTIGPAIKLLRESIARHPAATQTALHGQARERNARYDEDGLALTAPYKSLDVRTTDVELGARKTGGEMDSNRSSF